MVGTLISGGHSLSPHTLYLGSGQTEAKLYVSFKNNGDATDTFRIFPVLYNSSIGEIPSDELGKFGFFESYIPPGLKTATFSLTFTFDSTLTGTWYYRFIYERMSDGFTDTKNYSSTDMVVTTASAPGGEIQIIDSHSSKDYIFNVTDYNYCWIYANLKNVGNAETFEYRSYMKRISDGKIIYINDSTDWDHWASPGGDTDSLQKKFQITSDLDKGEWKHYIEYKMYTEDYNIIHTLETSTIVNVINSYGYLIIKTPTNATPSTIEVGQTSDIQLTVKNNSNFDDIFTIVSELKRRSDGQLLNLTPLYPQTLISSGITDSTHTYNFTAPVGSEGTYDLIIYYVTAGGYSETLNTSVVLTINPASPPSPGELQIESSGANPSSILVGEASQINVSIKNIGADDTFNIEGIFRDGITKYLNPDWGTITLNAGQTANHTYNFTGQIEDVGTYDFSLLYENGEGTVIELNTPTSLSISGGGIIPSAYWIGRTELPTVSDAGKKISVDVTLKNVGTGAGILYAELIDMNTGETLTKAETSNVEINSQGNATCIFTMPERNIDIRFHIGHKEGTNYIEDMQGFNHQINFSGKSVSNFPYWLILLGAGVGLGAYALKKSRGKR